jgi:aryl-phospho-beta-D-glucosidase BglC (GH1 family)
MKNYAIPESHLTPTLVESLNNNSDGTYTVYGVFVNNNALSVNRLHKGSFADIVTQKVEDTVVYLIPVPEFIVAANDTEFARYVQVHLVDAEDAKEQTDEEQMQNFVKAFVSKLTDMVETTTQPLTEPPAVKDLPVVDAE